ncbi:luciferin 4-monooxygenase-like [Vanessa cardui]|uniref:luciferin 4-monooxygenase-like n=1 Tax=Vanessa cardui TaxID=171605 RepID=UPI001F12B62F|nr:luciferin 4-monooxygenase-like [Vanessa cardui]
MDIGPKYHIGHLVFEHLKLYPDVVHQIDAATGEEETYASVLSRSIRLARSLRSFGLKPGDVLAIGGRNHLNVNIPFYAALFNGLPIVGVDPFFKYDEICKLFKKAKPKIAFCQSESIDIYAKAANALGLDIKLIAFDREMSTLTEFVQEYDNGDPEEEFRVAEFDIDKIYVFLITTSGTTGNIKAAAFNHKPFMTKMLGISRLHNQRNVTHEKALNLAPVHWVSRFFSTAYTPLVVSTMVQTSNPDDADHIVDIINKYKPQTALFSPAHMSFLVSRKDKVDMTCFRSISLTGSKIYPEVLLSFKKLLSNDMVALEAYGQTEMIGPVLVPDPKGPIGNCGRGSLPGYIVKLVDVDSREEIKETNVTGELLVKGLRFTEYYNDPEETALAFTEDGYFKTGDLLYRDENDNYYFVDRIKTLIKYRNYHVMPTEIEQVILSHPGVVDVCVVGLRDVEDGEHPAACVVRAPGSTITASDICDLVNSKLANSKGLRGGVFFVDSLPYTSTAKIARGKVKQLIEMQNGK